MILTKEDAAMIGVEVIFVSILSFIANMWVGKKGALTVLLLYVAFFILTNGINWWVES